MNTASSLQLIEQTQGEGRIRSNSRQYDRFNLCFSLGVMIALLASTIPLAGAHDGHDHDEKPPAATNAFSPKRQADGSVFLPAAAQRQMGIRTVLTAEANWSSAFKLNGKVVTNPNAGGRVQAAMFGRLQTALAGLPFAGQTVQRGQVLGYVVPVPSAIERSNQQAQQTELRTALHLAQSRLARLRQLSETVARKDIDAAAAEVSSLHERLQVVSAGLSSRDALVSPVSGVIASANAIAGQVVQPGEQIFEVIDPMRLRIEALVYEPSQAQQIGSASFVMNGVRVPLRLISVARSLRGQALPLMFEIESTKATASVVPLALNQMVQIVAQTKDSQRGIAVPASARVKNSTNQDSVWIKTAPERFEPRVITYVPIDSDQLRLISGVRADEQVVTQGASLINQVR